MFNPVLKSHSGKYGNNRWKVYSEKLEREVFIGSSLEYDYWVLVETDSTVKKYCEQPLKVEGYFNGKLHSSIPDMWIEYTDGSQKIIEIKHSIDLEGNHKNYQKVQKQISIQQSWCRENCIEHTVVTDIEIRKNPTYLCNMKIMLPYLRQFKNIEDSKEQFIISCIQNGATSIKELKKLSSDKNQDEIFPLVLKLIYGKRICANIEEETLSLETRLSLL